MNVVGNHAPHGRSVLVTPRALTWYYNVMIMTMFYLLLFVVIPLNFIISQLTPDGLHSSSPWAERMVTHLSC